MTLSPKSFGSFEEIARLLEGYTLGSFNDREHC